MINIRKSSICALGAMMLASPRVAAAETIVFLNFNEFPWYPSITFDHPEGSEGLDGFTGAPFNNLGGSDPYLRTVIPLWVLEKVQEDFADFDIDFMLSRPDPPTPFVQWGMDDRAYTFKSDFENSPTDDSRLFGKADASLGVSRTFAGSFALTPYNQPYDGTGPGVLSQPPLISSSPGDFFSALRIAQALANSAAHEIAHLFLAQHDTIGISLMSTQNEATMADVDKVFVGEAREVLTNTLGLRDGSGGDSNAGEMNSGSPTSLSQPIRDDCEFHETDDHWIRFSYAFRSLTGVLTVSLGGTELATIYAPGTVQNSFTPRTIQVPAPAICTGAEVELRFTVDETTPDEQATVLIDNVIAPGIVNGFFQTGLLDPWKVSATGNGSVNIVDTQILGAPPSANGGFDQVAIARQIVTLNAVASLNPRSGGLTYSWLQVAGPTVKLSQGKGPVATFDAPVLGENQTVTFRLIASDGTTASAIDTVDVTVQTLNATPVAEAGDNFNSKPGARAVLDGSHSYDPDGTALDKLTFKWFQVAGKTPVSLDTSDPLRPSFTVPKTLGDTLVFKLVVSDGSDSSVESKGADPRQPDTVAVGIVQNAAPLADAGPDQTRNEGTKVALRALASRDPDGDTLRYSWKQLSGPDVGIAGDTSATPVFEAPVVPSGGAKLVFQVTVSDNDQAAPKSDSDDVLVYVKSINDPPNCKLARASAPMLWPSDHKMIQVQVEGVRDKGDAKEDILVRIVRVTQDEPLFGQADGDSSPDAVVIAGPSGDTVWLRGERAEGGNGRVYRVSFTANDGFKACQGTVDIAVPPSRASTAIDDGQRFESTAR